MAHINVKAAARLSGISAHTLRAWERRYQAVKPDRSPSGRRSYSTAEIERLKLLALLVQKGHAISTIAELSDKKLSQMLLKTETAPTSSTLSSKQDSPQLLSLLKKLELSAIDQSLLNARTSYGAKAFALDVAAPFLSEVGQAVAKGELSVTHEHALSAILRSHLGQVLLSLDASIDRSAPKALLATPEGDLHEFGILISAILCASHGIKPHYLGPNLPAQDLLEAAEKLHPKYVILGTCDVPRWANPHSPETYIQKVANNLPEKTKLWIGGTVQSKKADLCFVSFEEFDLHLYKQGQAGLLKPA